MMKKIVTNISIIISCMGLMSSAMAGQWLDGVAATVNDSIITKSELDHAITITKKQIADSGMSLPSEEVLQKQILDQLINRKLQLDLAKEANLTVTDKQVEQSLNRIAAQNQMSLLELYQKIAAQGMTKSEYRQKLREEVLLQKIQQQEVADKILINPQEIDDFMHSKTWQASSKKEYHLADILISLPDEPTSAQINEAKSKAEALLKRIRSGMNFHTAAMTESGSTNALQGGDLGWRKLPEIPTAFADQVLQMKENEVKGPIQTSNGFHILHLAGTRNAESKGDPKLERQEVAQYIFQGKLEEGLQNWIMKIRSGAYISINSEKAKANAQKV